LIGLCRRIVDLVQTGETLKANGLVEIEKIADISSRLIVNRAALKTRAAEVGGWIETFRRVVANVA
jgi:ATP phosphoribosyltransferase